MTADFEQPTSYYNDPKFQGCTIHSIIVPLYHKIYLDALQARKLVFSILKNDILSSKISDKVVLRLLLTSSRSFKHAIATNLSIDRKVRDLILFTEMAKFVWVAELSNTRLFPQKKAFGLILLDATEANENSLDAMLFMVYANNFIIFNDKRVLEQTTVSFVEYDTSFKNLHGGF